MALSKKTVTLTNSNGVVEHLFQSIDCSDEYCDPFKHPLCWRCERCGKVHMSGCEAIKCAEVVDV